MDRTVLTGSSGPTPVLGVHEINKKSGSLGLKNRFSSQFLVFTIRPPGSVRFWKQWFELEYWFIIAIKGHCFLCVFISIKKHKTKRSHLAVFIFLHKLKTKTIIYILLFLTYHQFFVIGNKKKMVIGNRKKKNVSQNIFCWEQSSSYYFFIKI